MAELFIQIAILQIANFRTSRIEVSVVGFIRGKRQIRGSRVEIDRSAIGKIDDILVSSDGK